MLVKRFISVYDKIQDNLIHEIELSTPVEILRNILQAKSDDFNVFKIYRIDYEKFNNLSVIVPELAKLSFYEFDYFYEVSQVGQDNASSTN